MQSLLKIVTNKNLKIKKKESEAISIKICVSIEYSHFKVKTRYKGYVYIHDTYATIPIIYLIFYFLKII